MSGCTDRGGAEAVPSPLALVVGWHSSVSTAAPGEPQWDLLRAGHGSIPTRVWEVRAVSSWDLLCSSLMAVVISEMCSSAPPA